MSGTTGLRPILPDMPTALMTANEAKRAAVTSYRQCKKARDESTTKLRATEDAVLVAFNEGWSGPQLAEALGVHHARIKQMLAAARSRL